MDYLSKLPKDVLYEISQNLTYKEIMELSKLNKELHQKIDTKQLTKKLKEKIQIVKDTLHINNMTLKEIYNENLFTFNNINEIPPEIQVLQNLQSDTVGLPHLRSWYKTHLLP